MAITLKYIAEICGVDVSTVSRALRDDPRVKPETAEMIRAKAAELGYNPNLAARSLVSGRTLNLLMIIPDLLQAIVQEPAQYLSESLNRKGYDLLITLYQNNAQTFRHLMGRLSQNVADGAFIIPSIDYDLKTYSALVEKKFPLVFIDRKPDFCECTAVTTANGAAAAGLVNKCIEAGATRFAVLFHDRDSAAAARLKATTELLGGKGIPFKVCAGASGCDFVGGDKLAVVASAPGDVIDFIEANPALAKQHGMIAGVFDSWTGLSENYSHIFVCKQDFMSIADRAAELMLRKIESDSELFVTDEIPPLKIITLKGGN